MYKVLVYFYTCFVPLCVASFMTHAAAARRAREYAGADARGVWIESPDGSREAVR